MFDVDDELRTVFERFCRFGDTSNTGYMESRNFLKLYRDACLIDDTLLTPTDIDLIFQESKPTQSRRISFEQFRAAIPVVARRKYGNRDDFDLASSMTLVTEHILRCPGPVPMTTTTTTPADNGALQRLSDPNSTESHKNRSNAITSKASQFRKKGKGPGSPHDNPTRSP
mmetsp:Transcript_32354/g.52292  ORF Transcript_32354/g.52292 Transcript_32354/m.52292 type:complete len:170 (-) Transcript_32354:393-902(-)|eukprot:CAMPEP_0184343392 /NCGR_PEP_ID=MMETSP1089-20130417/11915_1 /TAXON_ID=38269 ORGANISM="Gloeochaete wittrockiana, Strain SAG46.84" /NCGR_SAMPLE_ID=MMETSP1089 /ASSEMBLY_ACC=CAM_ASM_000445 /LENGTH=169 /DNA_ID=CAMNT_0026672665 /DNA_START=176 /DNA_END=685 /DNA_ORIENTATION=-